MLLKGGPPVTMGPLGTNIRRHNHAPEATKSSLNTSRSLSIDETKYSSPSLTSSPSLHASGSLLNLKKIERKAKSTKILVNPVCSDSVGSSEDSNNPKKDNSKWKGKKKRLKADDKKKQKNYETNYACDKNGEVCRKEAREKKKSISCFKIKSSDDKSRSDEDQKSGKENCKNENSSNWRHCPEPEPDIVIDSRKNSKETLVDEASPNTDAKLKTDQICMEKTDSFRRGRSNAEVRILYISVAVHVQ